MTVERWQRGITGRIQDWWRSRETLFSLYQRELIAQGLLEHPFLSYKVGVLNPTPSVSPECVEEEMRCDLRMWFVHRKLV